MNHVCLNNAWLKFCVVNLCFIQIWVKKPEMQMLGTHNKKNRKKGNDAIFSHFLL
jgi:hypothetical protein